MVNFRKLISLYLLLVGIPLHAADTRRSIAACSAINGDLARLECFDSLAKSLGLSSPQSEKVPTKNIGKWRVTSSKNPIDDSKTAVASLEATGDRSKWGKSISLILRCQSGKTEAYIAWGDYLGSDSVAVLTRIGKSEAQSKEWSISSDKTATFYHGDAIAFIENLAKEKNFVAQATPYNENPKTAIFDLTGIENAVRPVRSACALPQTATKTDRMKALREGQRIKLKLKNGEGPSGAFSSYDDRLDTLYLKVVDDRGKETAFRSFKGLEILSVEPE